MPSLAQDMRVRIAVNQDIAHWMAKPCHPAPADGLTPLQAITPLTRMLAAAEWDAMDAQGNLPADWPERRAALIEQFEMKEARHG